MGVCPSIPGPSSPSLRNNFTNKHQRGSRFTHSRLSLRKIPATTFPPFSQSFVSFGLTLFVVEAAGHKQSEAEVELRRYKSTHERDTTED